MTGIRNNPDPDRSLATKFRPHFQVSSGVYGEHDSNWGGKTGPEKRIQVMLTGSSHGTCLGHRRFGAYT